MIITIEKKVNLKGEIMSKPSCPICSDPLKYDRNNLLKDGIARYYHCENCKSKVRIILGRKEIIK